MFVTASYCHTFLMSLFFFFFNLVQILLELDNFDDSLKLLNQGKLDGIEPDLLLYNTILQTAYEKVFSIYSTLSHSMHGCSRFSAERRK